MCATKNDLKYSETENEIDKIVQQKYALLQDSINEDKLYKEKRLALQRDLADMETCEIIIR